MDGQDGLGQEKVDFDPTQIGLFGSDQNKKGQKLLLQ
jgi:hypothetical protein